MNGTLAKGCKSIPQGNNESDGYYTITKTGTNPYPGAQRGGPHLIRIPTWLMQVGILDLKLALLLGVIAPRGVVGMQ
jgi:hypothetical protein